MDRSASQDATQRSEGAPPATDPLPRPISAEDSRGMRVQQQRKLQLHESPRVQQLGRPGPPRPSSSSPPLQMRVSSNEPTFGVGGAFGGTGGAGAAAEEEQQQSSQTLPPQPQQHSSPSPGGVSFRAEAGGVDGQQQRVQAPSQLHHPHQPQPQPQLQQAHPQHQASEAQGLTQAPLSEQPESAQQQQQQQEQQQQQQQQQQQPWPQQQGVQAQHDMSTQQQQQLQQQPQPQAQARTEAERWKPSASLLSGYVPPVANTQVDVPVLMQQTSAAIARWGDLQKSLDVRSDTATGNLAAQAQARSCLKRDLTNLTQLADAQTRHIQRMKVRHVQGLHVTKPPSQGWFPPGGGSAGSALTPTGTPGGVARGGASTTGEGFNFSPKPQVVNQLGTSPASAIRAGSIAPPSHAASGSMGAVLMQQGASRSGVPPHSLSATARGDGAEDVRAAGRTSEWAAMTAASSSQTSPLSGTPSPPPVQPQHASPSQQRMQVIKERLDHTEPRNKWVVLVDASLRLSPDEGPMFKHLCVTIQGFLSKYNGAVGAEVAQALRSCLDPRVFDAMNIKRSQERLADVYSRWAQRGGR